MGPFISQSEPLLTVAKTLKTAPQLGYVGRQIHGDQACEALVTAAATIEVDEGATPPYKKLLLGWVDRYHKSGL